jgi:predicted metal-dependent hydrolase
MKIRRPTFDFSGTPAHWTAIPEFAQMMNSSSLWIPPLERFLNQVMGRAAASLKGEDAETDRIKSDIRTFIRQESNHYMTHSAFNAILPNNGYDVAEFELLFEAEFKKLLSTKSLAFLCAYCEGFETLGPPSALIWLDEIGDLLEGARPEAVKLWKWHLMEEYEHRHVCHEVFHAVHGGYFLRVYGMFYHYFQMVHFTGIVLKRLLARDRAQMSASQIKASRKRARRVALRIAWLTWSRALKALSPFYTPREAREPHEFRSYMAKIEAELA